ncbi:GTPase [Sediminicola sp. 1XM1-17]|uniref:GTPase n=1 Tax=Sediminicola sp. 1XM1-17 TaxID=3127702 RepID=UPI003076B77F
MDNSRTAVTKEKLLFIYNANSGKRNAVMDMAHKILSPKTYECNLCDITFGVFSENSLWKNFRLQSSVEMEFLHKDEFSKAYASKFGHKFTFPIILADTGNGLEVYVGTEELNALEKAEDLIAILKNRG